MRKHPNATAQYSKAKKSKHQIYVLLATSEATFEQDHCKEQTENRSQQNADIAKTIPIVHDSNLHHG